MQRKEESVVKCELASNELTGFLMPVIWASERKVLKVILKHTMICFGVIALLMKSFFLTYFHCFSHCSSLRMKTIHTVHGTVCLLQLVTDSLCISFIQIHAQVYQLHLSFFNSHVAPVKFLRLRYVDSVGAKHYHTSAKQNKGIEELFLDLRKRMIETAQVDERAKGNGASQAGAARRGVQISDDESQAQSGSGGCCSSG
ncbi:hypothetical protein STEG23_033751 [Scotinomys teguina]